jgi:curved DNA-binding protein CbpA
MAPNLNSQDYYQILGVPKSADDAALKKAYKKLAVKVRSNKPEVDARFLIPCEQTVSQARDKTKRSNFVISEMFTHSFLSSYSSIFPFSLQWHPDKNPGDEQATKNFQKISEAYATLSDDKKRKIYDQYGKDAANQSDQMPDNMPMGGGGFGGMPGGSFSFRPGGGGGGRHMSSEEAQFIFSQFFGDSDPFGGFGGMGGGGGGGPGIRINLGGGMPRGGGSIRGGDPFGGSFGGMGDMAGMGGIGGMPGFGGQSTYRQQPARYDAIHPGTVVSLKGLINKPDRNGDRGQVVQYDPNSGRYIVQIEDSDETMKVKPSNLLQHVHVTLHGLVNRPEWNGQKGTIIAWDHRTERYNVYVMSTSKVTSLKPSNIVLENETVGQIVGVQAKPELNGKWGTIKQFNAQSGRYDVQISADQVLRLKLENIHV